MKSTRARIPQDRRAGPLDAAPLHRPKGARAAAAAGHTAAMSEWAVLGVVAVIVGILLVLLRMGVGD